MKFSASPARSRGSSSLQTSVTMPATGRLGVGNALEDAPGGVSLLSESAATPRRKFSARAVPIWLERAQDARPGTDRLRPHANFTISLA